MTSFKFIDRACKIPWQEIPASRHAQRSFMMLGLLEQSFDVGFFDDVIKWKHFTRYWSFVRGIHWSPVDSPHKGQWRGALMFSLICAWTNGCANNRHACDLKRHRSHYDVTIMLFCFFSSGLQRHKYGNSSIQYSADGRILSGGEGAGPYYNSGYRNGGDRHYYSSRRMPSPTRRIEAKRNSRNGYGTGFEPPAPLSDLTSDRWEDIGCHEALRNTWRRHFDVITSKLRRFYVMMTSLLQNVSAGVWHTLENIVCVQWHWNENVAATWISRNTIKMWAFRIFFSDLVISSDTARTAT